ncbi:MAG: ATP-dependent protease ATPase subunit HslU [Candidatus Eisenbacteria sp.]|nr:ATP-dependent protease ATPase subunit HslU [Candidatus Eisenbacteria bacterium]
MKDLQELTPKQITRELDKYIIGQSAAKKSVAIALRNRYRRRLVSADMRDEILPNNIIMIGPTGVGKTEIARRLARLAGAPFLKVEASKFTEVGYVGRDVESMIRDLAELAVNMVREEMSAQVKAAAERMVERRLLGLLLPGRPARGSREPAQASMPSLFGSTEATVERAATESEERHERTRDKLRRQLREGLLEEREVELDVKVRTGLPTVEIFSNAGLEEMEFNLPEHLQALLPSGKKRRKMTVGEARDVLLQEETSRLIDMDKVVANALERAQTSGIIFVDEIDKIAGGNGAHGPDVSRQGVQRDLLPIIEGSSVATRYGLVKTDHILFIAAGAFHTTKPADLIPELQGRFPIRVELSALTEDDFIRILTEPRNALLKQYAALLGTEGVALSFTRSAIERIAAIASEVNASTENIGARRLHTILTTLLEEVLFEVPEAQIDEVRVDGAEVDKRLSGILQDKDLSRYIL